MTETAAGTSPARQDAATPVEKYAAFISYARQDAAFARQLEAAIETHQSLKASRALRVFRDETDFTGSEYTRALQGHLERSASLIVVCSPHARRSTFVGDEIERFATVHGPERIFPVLIDGLPDNEADDRKSFPPALLKAAGGIPLAADFRGVDRAPRRFGDPRFESEWFKLLANLQNSSAAEIRADDKQRQLRELRRSRFRLIGLMVVATGVAVLMLLLWTRARRAEQDAQQTRDQAQTDLSEKDRQLADYRARLEQVEASARPAAASRAPAPPVAAPPVAAPPPPQPAPPADTASPATVRPAESPSAQAEVRPRVYFHIRDPGQRAFADQLRDRLQQSGYVVPGIQTLRVGPSANELRFFRNADETEAHAIERALALPGLVVKLIGGYETSPDMRPRHYELWLAPLAP
jgi:hypothetical protein